MSGVTLPYLLTGRRHRKLACGGKRLEAQPERTLVDVPVLAGGTGLLTLQGLSHPPPVS